MKLSGYEVGFRDEDTPTLLALGEASICTRSSEELRRIATFVAHAADQLDAMGDSFGHLHYRDWAEDWHHEDADLIVVKA